MQDDKWETEDEINFIQNLDREKFMKYVKSLSLRVEWGRIEEKKIMKFVNNRVANDAKATILESAKS